MALRSFFTVQFDLLKLFMLEPEQTVRCIQVATDMQPVLMKALAGLDSDSSPHLMLCCETPFAEPKQYFDGLLDELHGEMVKWDPQLRDAGFNFDLQPNDFDYLSAHERFITYASALADAFPDFIGSLVLILAPDSVADAKEFRVAIHYLAKHTPSQWLKFIVIDDRQKPALDKMEEENPHIWAQTFHIAPEEIERQAKEDLLHPERLDPTERRQYTALLAGFAFARREYDEALRLQQQWLELIGPAGAPSETASAYYNLGNTFVARKQYPEAEEAFDKALELSLDHNLGALVPMVLTNLGVTLYRQERMEQALQSFDVALATCKAQGLRPAEAHVLDCLAKTYEADGKLEEAERSWNEALAVYDSMSAETFAAAREGGRADILDKLARLDEVKKKREEEAQQADKSGWFAWRKGA